MSRSWGIDSRLPVAGAVVRWVGGRLLVASGVPRWLGEWLWSGSGRAVRSGRGLREEGRGDGVSWRVSTGVGELAVELHPWFLLRTTGRSARLIDGFGHPDLRRLTERLFAAERRLAAERRRFRERAAPLREYVLGLAAEERVRARRCLRSVRTGAPFSGDEIRLLETLGLGEWARSWQAAVVAAGSARAGVMSAYASARLVTRRKVAEAYDDESVREAVFLADPAFYQVIVRHPPARRPGDGTARRSRLLTAAAHRHLRRLAVGGGRGGPVLYARFDPGSGEALRVGEPGRERAIVEAGAWLAGRIRDLAMVEELRERYAGAPWPERARNFEAARRAVEDFGSRPEDDGRFAGGVRPGRAGPGRVGPAREQVFREERSSPFSERVTIGGRALARLRDALTAVLPLWYLGVLLAREDAAEAGADPSGVHGWRMRALREALAGLAAEVRRSGGENVIRLSGWDVAEATAGLWARAGEPLGPCLPSPYLMAVGRDLESATWLLSGLGDDCRPLYEGLAARLHSDPTALRHGLTGLAASIDPAQDRDRRGPVEVDLGDFTPRIMIDDLIYQRARWRLRMPEERGADAFDRWLAVHRLRLEHGLPRHVFVRHPARPAAFSVDFCDPFAVEDLARQEPAEVLISEMLPGPGQLWWRVEGLEQCAELRLGCRISPVPGP